MGEHADDTMNWDDDLGDHYAGDGGPGDQALDAFARGTLRATPDQVRRGMAFQAEVLGMLGHPWMESRRLILAECFSGRGESLLSRYEFSELNYLESVRGDLLDPNSGVAIECQTAVSGPDASWEHSKRLRSEAEWQCFGFTSGSRLMVRTTAVRVYLDRWEVEPQQSRREGGGPYYSLSEHFLRSIGAVDLAAWCVRHDAERRRSP